MFKKYFDGKHILLYNDISSSKKQLSLINKLKKRRS